MRVKTEVFQGVGDLGNSCFLDAQAQLYYCASFVLSLEWILVQCVVGFTLLWGKTRAATPKLQAHCNKQ